MIKFMKIDTADIQLREIGPDEVELLTKYRMAYLAEMQGEKPKEYQEKLSKELNIFFKEALADNRFFAYMALLNGEILSFGGMVIKKIPGDFNQSSYLEGDILNMYTVPQARRQGISAMILQRLIDEARKKGISKISLHTSKDGEKLYRKFGFSEPVYPVLEFCI
jgi:GNAT superfamily N-acetyltransferase